MERFPPTIILRHRKENLKKCSLSGLAPRNDVQLYTYPSAALPDLSSHLLLTLDAPPLGKDDDHLGIVLLDATWRYAQQMQRQLRLPPTLRSIPSGYRTAYPRRQNGCSDPERGLASIEALFLAYHILGRDTRGLLTHYYWGEPFLQKNGLIPGQ